LSNRDLACLVTGYATYEEVVLDHEGIHILALLGRLVMYLSIVSSRYWLCVLNTCLSRVRFFLGYSILQTFSMISVSSTIG
jgi:hypothetical protein